MSIQKKVRSTGKSDTGSARMMNKVNQSIIINGGVIVVDVVNVYSKSNGTIKGKIIYRGEMIQVTHEVSSFWKVS